MTTQMCLRKLTGATIEIIPRCAGTSAGLFAIALGIAVLTRAMIADRSEENPLYEDAAEVQNCVSEEMNEETVVVPNYLRAR